MAEVDEQTKPEAGGFEVVVDLCPVFIGQLGDRLQFKDDLIVTDEVRFVLRPQAHALVLELQWHLGHERDALETQLAFHALLVNRFVETAPLLAVHLEARPDDAVALLLQQQVG